MYFYFLGLLVITFPLCAVENTTMPNLSAIQSPSAMINNEIKRLDHLIQATQKSLEGQKVLRERIIEYKKIQEAYDKNPNNNDILYQMVKIGHKVLESIKENHLTQNFDPEFLSELTAMSQVASKRGLPKP